MLGNALTLANYHSLRWCAEFGNSRQMQSQWVQLADETVTEAQLTHAVGAAGQELREQTLRKIVASKQTPVDTVASQSQSAGSTQTVVKQEESTPANIEPAQAPMPEHSAVGDAGFVPEDVATMLTNKLWPLSTGAVLEMEETEETEEEHDVIQRPTSPDGSDNPWLNKQAARQSRVSRVRRLSPAATLASTTCT